MSVDLRERLRRVLGPTRPSAATDHEQAPPRPATRRDGRRERDVQHLVPGAVVEGPHGACFVAERAFDLGHEHGDGPLGRFFDLSDRGLGCLARSPSPLAVDREAILFLDTETTGLAGGTGTYAFLVGVGFFQGERFIVRQFFMRDHAEEPALLTALNGTVGPFEAVVTFNGKSFDVPLLMTRYTANRQRPALRASLHLDLLHPSRRVWRDRLDACNLGTIEMEVLGHRRSRDVPSWMIPELYFRYVRGGESEPMALVFEHNAHDILSLVALACRLGHVLDGPEDAGQDVRDHFAAGRIFEDLGLLEDACTRYERALAMRESIAIRAQVAARLAAICKRAGRHERALQLWRRLATLGLSGCEPHVELAKHYEHRLRDYSAAITVVEEALAIVELRQLRRQAGAAAERADLERRLARLLAKRSRQSPH